MLPARHHLCNQRLFDSLHPTDELTGPSPDIAVKCPRCSRQKKYPVVVKYRLKLPRWIAPVVPEAVYCSDMKCLARLCDLSLPYTIVENFGDIQIKCPKCGKFTELLLQGIAHVA